MRKAKKIGGLVLRVSSLALGVMIVPACRRRPIT